MERPYLKGKIHAFAALGYNYISLYLIQYIPEDIIFPITFYLVCVFLHFVTSSLLHIYPWKGEALLFMRKVDHVCIFIKIIATYYAYISTIMTDVNIYLLTCLFGGGLLGILSRIFYTDTKKEIIAIPYLMVGWSIIFDFECMYKLLTEHKTIFLLTLFAGSFFTIGAIIYMLRYPNPIPGILEYHEMFHICGTIGTLLFTYSIFFHAIPYHVNQRL